MRIGSILGWLSRVLVLTAVLVVVAGDLVAQGRGSSFGGSRGASRSYSVPRSAPPPSSFGGSRSYSVPRSAPPPSSFGGSRSYSVPRSSLPPSSFGRSGSGGSPVALPRSSNRSTWSLGTPLGSPDSYRRSYGIPRRQEVRTITTPEGQRNVILHSYGGYADGLLMGYLMGQTSWLWFTPFHPAFYYSQPYYVPRPDGTVEYYPPTFSPAKVIFMLIVVGTIAFIVWVIIRTRRAQRRMLAAGDLSRSSFGG